MPRSERCRIRGNCLHGIALPSLAQALSLTERLALPGQRQGHGRGQAAPASAAHRAGASRRKGLEPFRRPLGGCGRAVETRQRGHEDSGDGMGEAAGGRATRPGCKAIGGRAGSAPPGGSGNPPGPSSQARAERGSLEQAKGVQRNPVTNGAKSSQRGGLAISLWPPRFGRIALDEKARLPPPLVLFCMTTEGPQ